MFFSKQSFIQSCFEDKLLSSSNGDLPHSDQVVSVASKQGLERKGQMNSNSQILSIYSL